MKAALSNVPVMVLAAGLGTRLRPLTEELPKPAVPVANRPLLAHALDVVRARGGERVVVNAFHLADRLATVARAHGEGLDVHVLREGTLLGTGGGIRNARELLLERGADTVVVLNSDILFEPDLGAAMETHRRLGAIATMVLRSDPEAARYGAIEIDETARVRRLLGDPSEVPVPTLPFMFTGVHVLSRAAFADLPESGCIVRHAYRSWVDRGAVVAGHVDESPWRDLGTLEAYLEANLAAARDAGGALVAPSARLGRGATLREVVVGEGAEIGAAVTLERTVVWAGARVFWDLRDAVVTPSRVVPVPS